MTTLHNESIDEQLIKEWTGHRSETVREYKCTSAGQQKNVSKLVVIPLVEHVKTEPNIKSEFPTDDVITVGDLSDEEGDNLILETTYGGTCTCGKKIPTVGKCIQMKIEENTVYFVHKKFKYQEYQPQPDFDLRFEF